MILVAPGQPHIHAFFSNACSATMFFFLLLLLFSLKNSLLKSCKSCFSTNSCLKVHFLHTTSVSRKMPARGLYRKLSKTDRARALGCIDVGMRSREVERRFRTSHQTITRIVQRYRHSREFKDLPRSGRPRVTTRAEDRYFTNVVVSNRFVTSPEVRSRLYAARGPRARIVSVKTVRNRIHAGGFKSMFACKEAGTYSAP